MKLFDQKISPSYLPRVNKILINGDLGFGSNVQLFEKKFYSYSQKRYNVATNSASASAFMIFAYLQERYGKCDVYTTSLGFASPAWAAKHFGHNLIFVDVQDDLQFCCSSYRSLRQKTSRQVVVMPVLYGGVSDIENFELMGDEIVVVDSAHCITPKIKSDFIFFSFHPYKPVCSSDGGMISTESEDANDYFKNYRNFGRVTSPGGYNITQNGFKFYMNNLNATIALCSLEEYDTNLLKRKSNYQMILKKVKGLKMLSHDDHSSYYFATALTESADECFEQMNVVRHYPMLHQTSHFQSSPQKKLLKLEDCHDTILNIPIHHNLFQEDMREIVAILNGVL
jgi:perosamine synthetase